MYEEILVPTDGSPAAEAALDHAIDLASTYGARLHALYVVDATAFSSVEAGAELVVDALEEEGEEAVERVHDVGGEAGVDVVTAVESGSTSSGILDYVESNGVDLVVMGTHGRRGVERFLLGSVTERVIRSADVPVMTVRMPDEE